MDDDRSEKKHTGLIETLATHCEGYIFLITLILWGLFYLVLTKGGPNAIP